MGDIPAFSTDSQGIRKIAIDLVSGRGVITFRILEAISKTEKWFEVKDGAGSQSEEYM